MATLTIELDDETLRKVERAAEQERVSVDRWASEHLAEAVGGAKREKSFSKVVAEVAGTVPDLENPRSGEGSFSEHLAKHFGSLADTDLEVPSDEDFLPLKPIDFDSD